MLNTRSANTRTANPKSKGASVKSQGIFGLISKLEGDWLLDLGLQPIVFSRGMFLFFLTLIYIANSHWANNLISNIARNKKQLEQAKNIYTTYKYQYMLSSKQSEIANKVKAYGIQESEVPPKKIILKD